jgi:hypothetical protein
MTVAELRRYLSLYDGTMKVEVEGEAITRVFATEKNTVAIERGKRAARSRK